MRRERESNKGQRMREGKLAIDNSRKKNGQEKQKRT